MSKTKKYERKRLEEFKFANNSEIITERISSLEKIIEKEKNIERQKEFEKRLIILKELHKLFSKKNRDQKPVTDDDIRNLFDQDHLRNINPIDYIRRYGENSQYRVLPDIMESDYDDIPDENGLSKFELLEIISKYGERISDIKSQEKSLTSKLDCSLYAEKYLDTLEEISTLYRKRLIPRRATDYFENSFAYGINLINWYFRYVLEKTIEDCDMIKCPKCDQTFPEITRIEDGDQFCSHLQKEHKSEKKYIQNKSDEENNRRFVIFAPSTDFISQSDIEKEDDRWTDFKWFCRGGDTRKKFITCFDYSLNNQQITLPDAMYEYDSLPAEEGIRPEEVLKIMREYSTQLTELSDKETTLKNQIDCSVYAEQYLDILDQIAYLFNNKSLTTDSSTYFENNFSYGLTLKIWYDYKVFGAMGQENRWSEFLKYCENFKDDEGNLKPIKPFILRYVLPAAMLYYHLLPIDLSDDVTLVYPKDSKANELQKIEYDELQQNYSGFNKEGDDQIIENLKNKYGKN